MNRDDRRMTPGSKRAVELGCTCPVLDNNHGAGVGHFDADGLPMFWHSSDCPVHWRATNRVPAVARRTRKISRR